MLWVDDGRRPAAATTAACRPATTCCGSSPTCASSIPAARRPTIECDGDGVHHLLRRGPPGRGGVRRRRRAWRRCARRAASSRSTRRSSAPVGPGDLVLVHAGAAIAVAGRTRRERTSVTDFLYPFIEGDERDAGALLDDLAASARAKAADSDRAPRGDARARGASRLAAAAARWPSASRPAAGCSPSATVAARPTRRPSPTCSPPAWGDRASGPLPRRRHRGAHRARQRRRLRPGVLAPADRPRPSRRHRRSACRPAAARATCSPRSQEARRARACSRSASPATTAARWPSRATSTTASWCASDSVHRIQETQAALGVRAVAAVQERLAAAEAPCADAGVRRRRREAAVLDRIEAFRRRRPRLHRRRRHAGPRRRRQGVGRAGRRGVPRSVRRRPSPAPLARRGHVDAAQRRAAGVQHRLVRGAAAAVPGWLDRSPRRARHRQRPRRAGRRPDVARRPRS